MGPARRRLADRKVQTGRAPLRAVPEKDEALRSQGFPVTRRRFLSFFGGSPDKTFTLGRDHWHTEEHMRATGLPWTFLRMNLYRLSRRDWRWCGNPRCWVRLPACSIV